MQSMQKKLLVKLIHSTPRSITTLKKIMNEEESIDVDAALKQSNNILFNK